SLDPADKRYAVQTEDHPLEYATFEGIIPPGEYGAGPMIVWDLGRYEPIGDLDQGLQAGKLLFDLKGYKLRGKFALVRMKPKGKQAEWLLLKEKDAFVVRGGGELPATSVLTGRAIEELHADGPARLLEACERAGAARHRVDPAD